MWNSLIRLSRSIPLVRKRRLLKAVRSTPIRRVRFRPFNKGALRIPAQAWDLPKTSLPVLDKTAEEWQVVIAGVDGVSRFGGHAGSPVRLAAAVR